MPTQQARGWRYSGECPMHDIISLVSANGLWVMIIAVVAIGAWFKYREHELRVQQELRTKEMEHQQKMKELELELEKTKARQSPTPVR
jgi:predicted negative regulator of RcsB-dependent stress response